MWEAIYSLQCTLKEYWLKIYASRTSLVVRWSRLCASTAEAVGSIPGQETKIPHAVWHSQKQNKQKYARTAPGTQGNILGIIFTYKKM